MRLPEATGAVWALLLVGLCVCWVFAGGLPLVACIVAWYVVGLLALAAWGTDE